MRMKAHGDLIYVLFQFVVLLHA